MAAMMCFRLQQSLPVRAVSKSIGFEISFSYSEGVVAAEPFRLALPPTRNNASTQTIRLRRMCMNSRI